MVNQGKNAGNPVGLPSILTQGERESACIKHGSDSLYHPKLRVHPIKIIIFVSFQRQNGEVYGKKKRCKFYKFYQRF